MENASKALIIAGAILISILLISLGILIYNQATNITNSDQMSEVEKSSFNSKFQQYEGEKKNGTDVRALTNQVITSNSSESNADRHVKIVGDIEVEDNEITSGTITNSAKYKIQISKYSGEGLVEEITIEKTST